MLGSSRVAAQLAASREGLGSMSDEIYYLKAKTTFGFTVFTLKLLSK
jgi:hypothetical protein